jgi:L,D-peptidoglycan transpeptidase YkuD (ErfK/YbiS/YcfS/YnhG family)
MKRTSNSISPARRSSLIAVIAITAVAAAASALAPRPALAAGTPLRTLAVAAIGVPLTADSPAATGPLPSHMKSTAGCSELIIVTAAKLGDTTGTLQVFDKVGATWVLKLTVAARLGKSGVIDGLLRKAGDNATPTGIWAMPNYVFGTHLHAPTGTKMKYRRMDSRSWWSSKRGKTYNTWVEARHWTGEHIARSPKAYELAVSTGYNAKPNPSVYGRGSGIFLHVAHVGLTAGCVEIARADMIKVCKLLDRTKHPHFAIGTLQADTPTSIWAY